MGFTRGAVVRFLFVFAGFLGLTVAAQPALANTQPFTQWLNNVRQEAYDKGISLKTIHAALPDDIRPIPRIIELDRKQPEGTRTLAQYLAGTVSAKRQADGRMNYSENKTLLYKVGADYQVDPQVVVALWGIETNFGKNTGGFDVVNALLTLAYDGRRSAYFRNELMSALKIIDEEHISHENMKGSWAGAMGQTQFMPSSFYRFAQDYNKDGRTDIWTQKPDVFASAANYLARSGWKQGAPWGRKINLPKDFDRSLLGLDEKRSLQFWFDKGVRRTNGKALEYEGSYQSSVIQPDGPGTQAYIVYDNFRVIMKWNKSTYFATAVGLLSDRIKDQS
jgi:membrane-bound lytic murein transglycosylase B